MDEFGNVNSKHQPRFSTVWPMLVGLYDPATKLVRVLVRRDYDANIGRWDMQGFRLNLEEGETSLYGYVGK